MRNIKQYTKQVRITLITLLMIVAYILLNTSPVGAAGTMKCFAPVDSGGYQEFDCNILKTVDPITFQTISSISAQSSGDLCFKLRASGSGIGGPSEIIDCATATGQKPPQCYKGEYVRTPDGDKHVFRADYCTPEYQQKLGKSFETGKCYLLEYDNSLKVVYNGETTCTVIAKAVQDNSGITGDVVNDGGAGNPKKASTPPPNGSPSGSANGGTPAKCGKGGEFFGLPTWYEFLPPGDNCSISLQKTDANGVPQYDNGKNVYDFNKIWLVALAIADILLWIAGLLAVLFVIYGGYQYITSQFDPEGTKKAKDTIINALIGLSVAILSSAIVRFVGSKL